MKNKVYDIVLIIMTVLIVPGLYISAIFPSILAWLFYILFFISTTILLIINFVFWKNLSNITKIIEIPILLIAIISSPGIFINIKNTNEMNNLLEKKFKNNYKIVEMKNEEIELQDDYECKYYAKVELKDGKNINFNAANCTGVSWITNYQLKEDYIDNYLEIYANEFNSLTGNNIKIVYDKNNDPIFNKKAYVVYSREEVKSVIQFIEYTISQTNTYNLNYQIGVCKDTYQTFDECKYISSWNDYYKDEHKYY